MNKRLVSLVLSGVIVLSNASYINNVYANESIKSEKLIEKQDTKSQQVVYLTDEEGEKNVGNGTQQSPYQNIRTALDNIKDGDILKLVGDIQYTKYDKHTDGSALPLLIDKDIVIEGESTASFSLRAPIQLGADVTFKNLRLEMVPEVSLGRNIGESKLGFGQEVARSATIFVAGNTLTLDNIDTTMGTNPDQYNSRPYISGGSYKNTGKLGNKSIINIVNPNSETKISGIYAGDYWYDRDLDVEINLDGKLIDTTIYTGGVDKKLNGDVVVNLGTKSNAIKFDKTNHNGNLDVNLKSGFFNATFDTTGINNLSLEENAKVRLSTDANFDVNNVTLKNDSAIDFRDMSSNPIVNSNFEGVENTNDSIKGGIILLNNEQTLDIKGMLTGTTRLNNGYGYVNIFKDNHVYVKADKNSTGNLSIEDSIYDEFVLITSTDNNCISWITSKDKQGFKDFRWVGGDDKITNQTDGEYVYPIEFINNEGQSYKPDYIDIVDDFEYTLTKPDKTVVDYYDNDRHITLVLNDEKMFDEDPSVLNEMLLYTQNINELSGEMVLTATHRETGKSISKTIYIVGDTDKLTGSVSISGKAIEGETISVDTSGLQGNPKDLTYKWYVNDVLDTEQTGSNFTLTKEHIGKNIKVEVEAKNYLGTVFSSEVLVKQADIIVEEDGNGSSETPTIIKVNTEQALDTILSEIEDSGRNIYRCGEPKITDDGVLEYTLKVVLKEQQNYSTVSGNQNAYYVVIKVDETAKEVIDKLDKIEANKEETPDNSSDIELKELAGQTRYDTAIKVSQERFKDGQAQSVILVGKDAVVDGLAAAPLAISEDAPILFADVNSLNNETKEEILRVLGNDINQKTIYIVGGTAKISQTVESSIANELGVKSVERISGEDRYLTSIELAKKLNNNSNVAFVVGGNGEADAMSISAKAAELKAPIVVVEKDKLSEEAKTLLENKEIYIIGGVNCISENVKLELDKLDLNNNSERSAGQDRKETNAIVIDKFYDLDKVLELFVAKDGYVGGNDKLVDALAAAPLAATKSSPILLTTDGLNKMQQDNVKGLKKVSKIVQIGYGISKDVINSIVELIKNK